MYQLIGGELSPYTAKVRCYLRFKKIIFDSVQASAEVHAKFIKPKVGWSVMPVLVTPKNIVIQDSHDIISALEKRHSFPSIIPSTPKQKIVSQLMEIFCDDWLVLPMMHYRWSFDEHIKFLNEEFGRMAFPRESSENRSEVASMVYAKFKGMLPILGITDKTAPVIEKNWKEMLRELNVHFDNHPYLLGGRPCIGDFSLAGMAYCNLFRDPVPGYLMKTTAPLVSAWVEHMNGHLAHPSKLTSHHVDSNQNLVRDELSPQDTDFCVNDDIPVTLLPILQRFFAHFGPVLFSTKELLLKYIQENPTADKLPRNLGWHTFTMDDVSETRGAFPLCIWKWQLVTDIYRTLADNERLELDHWVSQFPHGLEVLSADLNDCRVERRNNFFCAARKINSEL